MRPVGLRQAVVVGGRQGDPPTLDFPSWLAGDGFIGPMLEMITRLGLGCGQGQGSWKGEGGAQMWGSGQVQDRDRLLEIQVLLCMVFVRLGREGAGQRDV